MLKCVDIKIQKSKVVFKYFYGINTVATTI